LSQTLVKLSNRLTPNQKRFVAEAIGTFIVVVFATGSVVLDSKMHGVFSFIAFAPFVAIAICVYMFGKISMAHFNPAVTLGFLITNHITKVQLVYYLCAEIIGALLGSLFVKYAIGFNANLGANAPNYSFSIPLIFGIEVLATALLMAVIFTVAYTKGLRGFGGLAIGGIVGLDIFFFGIYFRRIYESSTFISTCIIFRRIRKSMALLVCYFCWNINCCLYHKRKICQECQLI